MAKKTFRKQGSVERIAPELSELRRNMLEDIGYGSLMDVDRIIAKIAKNKPIKLKEIKF